MADEQMAGESGWRAADHNTTFNQEPVWRRLRRSVPERRCSTCDGDKVVEGHAWRRIDETTGFPARELLPCPACSVPGVTSQRDTEDGER